METTKVFFDRGLDKKIGTCMYYGILVKHKKDKILPFATTWMDFKNVMLSEISQS